MKETKCLLTNATSILWIKKHIQIEDSALSSKINTGHASQQTFFNENGILLKNPLD